ncbi:MAG: hypothetical protein ACRC2R_06990 [Xenococcaceae cyanobacterium]
MAVESLFGLVVILILPLAFAMNLENTPAFILLIAAAYLLSINLLLNLARWIAKAQTEAPRNVASFKQRSEV